MIRLTNVSAQAAPLTLKGVTLEMGEGSHALVGTRQDGGPLLLAVLAGWVRPRRGDVFVLGQSPELARKKVAYVPLAPRLPPSLLVAEVLETAAELRGERAPSPRDRLAAFGLSPLAGRRVETLSTAEARAVLVAEALTSQARVILLDEPRVDLDARAAAPLGDKLRERAASGGIVVIATSSPRDAIELAHEQVLFSHGAFLGTTHASDPALVSSGAPWKLRVLARDARALLSALALDPDAGHIALDGRELLLEGPDLTLLAAAVGRAALATAVEIESMVPDTPALDELRAAATRRTAPPRPSFRPSAPPWSPAEGGSVPPGGATP